MNKSILLGCLFALLMMSPSAAVADFERTKIAVLDFTIQGKGHETEDMGQIVAEWLITAFVKEGRFDVIERRLLKKILGEQELGATGVLDQDSVSQLGKLLGVKVVISGSVMRFQNIIEVNARIIDVESASIIAAESVKDTSAIGLEALVVSMAEKIIKDFPLEGYIVHRVKDVVSIDLGKRLGVKRKMQFVAYKEGEVIKHPTTGEILDVETIDTGLIEIIKVGSKVSKAIIIKEQSPNAIAYGQRVKSIGEPALHPSALTPKASLPKAKPPKTAAPVAEQEIILASDNFSPRSDAYAQAEALFKEKKYDDVIRLLLGPDHVEPNDFRLNILLAKAQLEKCAILKEKQDVSYKTLIHEPYRIGRRLHKINKTHPEPYYIVAKSLLINNRARKAGKTIKKALRYSPNNAEYLVVLGDAWSLLDDPRSFYRAKDAYGRAMSLKKDDEEFRAKIEEKIRKLSEK